MSENLVNQPKTEQEAFLAMDKMDDEQVLSEMQSQVHSSVAEKLYYSFAVSGKLTEGLSKKGVDECCRFLATRGEFIREEEIKFTPDPTNENYMLFSCRASRIVIQGGQQIQAETVIGMKRQCIYQDQAFSKADPFWYEKGAMKAARNARERLLPQLIKSQFLAQLKEKKATAQPYRTTKDGNGKYYRQETPEEQKQLSKPVAPIADFTKPNWEKELVPKHKLPQSLQGRAITFEALATNSEIKFTSQQGRELTGRQLVHIWEEKNGEMGEVAKALLQKFPSKAQAEPVEVSTNANSHEEVGYRQSQE